ncbi:hypothetical protein PGT21_009962 [Puccinia graminis f. sp. tritici]|uniref:Uncharacterized protein n=1 Tax=Puccinia graminis f. sp. tritici TaxID=56615 RepID=A0A5B0MSC3_PUCGR|nr:hypothetical protein PGT21_011935 [Puccinia graminis f. sp. tritici]KAA1082668.1 hypothetical protein PGT21_009962 [Puccinia graminis f. sp. tritici]KAA1133433.1 hypothetical protein PGTUg99_009577 [Puccinia graminis f. sp. tritici]
MSVSSIYLCNPLFNCLIVSMNHATLLTFLSYDAKLTAEGSEYKPPIDAKLLAPYECRRKPLILQNWEDLQVDGYIRFYPYGIELNIAVSSQDTCFTYR